MRLLTQVNRVSRESEMVSACARSLTLAQHLQDRRFEEKI